MMTEGVSLGISTDCRYSANASWLGYRVIMIRHIVGFSVLWEKTVLRMCGVKETFNCTYVLLCDIMGTWKHS